jgi:hypothetical protein
MQEASASPFVIEQRVGVASSEVHGGTAVPSEAPRVTAIRRRVLFSAAIAIRGRSSWFKHRIRASSSSRCSHMRTSPHNQRLVPTRTGEAPLLAAQPRR